MAGIQKVQRLGIDLNRAAAAAEDIGALELKVDGVVKGKVGVTDAGEVAVKNEGESWAPIAWADMGNVPNTAAFPGIAMYDPGGLADGSYLRSPINILVDPTQASLGTPGKEMAMRLHMGDNPNVATPGANDAVLATWFAINGNGRYLLWGHNLGCFIIDGGAGYIDGSGRAQEIELLKGFATTETDPWGGGNRLNGRESVSHTGSVGNPTAFDTTWSPNADGAGWALNGYAFSRIKDVGILFERDPGLGTDTLAAFGVAAIHDRSQSLNVLKVSGDHAGAVIDLSDMGTIGRLIRGDSNADTGLDVSNGSDFALTLALGAGNSAAQQVVIRLDDRGVAKWGIFKPSGNNWALFNYQNGRTALGFDTSNNATFDAGLTVDGAVVSFAALPTSDPGVAGRLWRDGSNFVKVSV